MEWLDARAAKADFAAWGTADQDHDLRHAPVRELASAFLNVEHQAWEQIFSRRQHLQRIRELDLGRVAKTGLAVCGQSDTKGANANSLLGIEPAATLVPISPVRSRIAA